MAELNLSRLRDAMQNVIGPTPWYSKTFPAIVSSAGQRFVWTREDDSGPLAYVVSLVREDEPAKPLLALNTYCRPFLVPEGRLGIWCPEGRSLRIACFDPAQLQPFDFAEIAGWFKQSSERIYAATAPVADFEVPLSLEAGVHKIEVPAELQAVKELIAPSSFPARSADDPAFALFVFYLHAGLVEVLPQRWFTASQYEVGKQWITRAARDPESHRIFGECFGAGSFLLEEDGVRLERWMEKE